LSEEKIGHNSVGEAGKKLSGYVERLERLQAEIDGLKEDQKDIFQEVKSSGFDTKVLKAAMKRRRMDKSERAEFDETLALYEHALETILS
jgi:uncharacterized protein (UPF0335 family)